MSEIVQDLCDQHHTFFYLKDDRKPCPYCKIERLEALAHDYIESYERLAFEQKESV